MKKTILLAIVFISGLPSMANYYHNYNNTMRTNSQIRNQQRALNNYANNQRMLNNAINHGNRTHTDTYRMNQSGLINNMNRVNTYGY